MPRQRAASTPAGVCCLVLLVGCAGTVQVQPLATGRSAVQAYVLTGVDPQALRHQAQRLCPLGADVLRQATARAPAEKINSRWRAALAHTAAWLEPPQPAAQIVVVCAASAEQARVEPPAAPAPAAAPKPPKTAASAAEQASDQAAGQAAAALQALPVGPTVVQW